MSPPGYQAPVVKARQCSNGRQEKPDMRKAGGKGSRKKTAVAQSVGCPSKVQSIATLPWVQITRKASHLYLLSRRGVTW